MQPRIIPSGDRQRLEFSLLASFLGGCAGSTSGGIKMNRLIILWSLTQANLARLIMPHAVIKIRYGSSEVSGDIAQNVLLYLFLYSASLIIRRGAARILRP